MFVDVKDTVDREVTRIFYGKAMITTPDYNSDLISLKFIDSEMPSIYTNKKQLLTKIGSKIVNKYLDKEKATTLFFRGCINKKGKFESFNGKFYCDIYIME